LQWALIAFLAIANDLAVLIFCDALFHTFTASMVHFLKEIDHGMM
jgi:hypothetical protein